MEEESGSPPEGTELTAWALFSRRSLTMGILLLIIVIVLLLGGLPHWGYHSYGYAPSGLGAVLLIILLVLLLTGRL
jgi:fumarate reductase subunit D